MFVLYAEHSYRFSENSSILCMYLSSTYQLRMGKVLTVLTAPFLRALLYCISICHILQILFVLCLSQSDSDNNNEAQRNKNMHGLVFLVHDKSLNLSLLPIIPWCNTLRFGKFLKLSYQIHKLHVSHILIQLLMILTFWHFVVQMYFRSGIFVMSFAIELLVSHKLVGNWLSNELLSTKI